jgi:FixJ family two-component response regulator
LSALSNNLQKLSGTRSVCCSAGTRSKRALVILFLEGEVGVEVEAGVKVELLLVHSGEACLNLYDRIFKEIDMALLYFPMSCMYGDNLVKEVHAREYVWSLLFICGYADTGLHIDFTLEKGLELIIKPFYTRQAFATVNRTVVNAGPTGSHLSMEQQS